ncbi:DNA topoisomerase VI subunit B [Candidatus Woesearchaeota archaeon]|nr:DNA topoisomerase VI subunit B [Candidatus Woesearchaeota archaeon]
MATAHELAKKQQDIGVAEFFSRNRHLLGFDNKRKSLMTTIKEAVDNSLDACEESDILPEITIDIIDLGNDRYRIIVEDNGPGIIKQQIPKIFAKLLYGSKFFKMAQTRGQQGIGISAAVMYAQLTTGKPAKITSKIEPSAPAHYYELHIDTQKNLPEIVKEETVDWAKDHGTKIELELEGTYQQGSQSVDEYLKETAITNPHASIVYTNPKAEQLVFARASEEMPKKPVEIKPHPYGVELGVLQRMLKSTESKTLQSFLMTEFSRVGPGTAKEICQNASLLTSTKPSDMSRELVEKLVEGIKNTKIIVPPSDCISPIGAELLEKGLRKEINAEFYAATARPPSVYRGNPFVIEAGLAYGGEQPAEEPIRLMRYANRVPLLYQQGACAATKALTSMTWRNYGLNQSKGGLPAGPVTVVISISSVWVPFTSESKEAIAHYPEIIKEIKLVLQDIGRKLLSYVGKKRRILSESKKRDYIQIYMPHIVESLKEILGSIDEESTKESLVEILETHRGTLEKIEATNEEFDPEFAAIGKEDKSEDDE